MSATIVMLLALLFWFAPSRPAFAQDRETPAPDRVFSFQEKDGYTVPMEYDPRIDGVPVIYLKINGSEPLPFALDTGNAYSLTFDTWAADKLKLKKVGDATEYGKRIGDVVGFDSFEFVFAAGSKHFDYELDKNLAIKKDIYQKSIHFSHRKIAGIIGIPLLTPMCAQFDFAEKKIVFFTRNHAPVHIPGAIHLPLQQIKLEDHDQRFSHLFLFAGLSSVYMLVDTGFYTSSIPKAVGAYLNNSSLGSYYGASTIDTDVSGLETTTTLSLLYPYLDFDGQREPNISLAAKWDKSQFGTFGMDFLARFRVTMDFPNKMLILERAKDYASRIYQTGNAYAQAQKRGEACYVVSVEDGSPAQTAGLQIGDHVLSIDGYDLTPLVGDVPMRLLQGYANTIAELKVERKGGKGKTETLTIKYLRGNIFAMRSPFAAGLGMDLNFGADGKTTALILKGSAAEQAGIQNGDEIVTISGKALRSLSADQLVREIQRSAGKEITLTAQHPGEDKPREVKYTAPKPGS